MNGRLQFAFVALVWALFVPPGRAESLVLADFNGEPFTNSGGEISAHQRIPSAVKWSLNAEEFHGTEGKSLRLEYIRLRGGEECYLLLRIPGVDLSTYDSLSFWVKGVEGGEIFDVALRDAEGDRADRVPEAAVPIEKSLVGGLTTDWQKVSIPLATLLPRGVAGKSGSLLIVFNRITKYSTIFVDDIELEKKAQ